MDKDAEDGGESHISVNNAFRLRNLRKDNLVNSVESIQGPTAVRIALVLARSSEHSISRAAIMNCTRSVNMAGTADVCSTHFDGVAVNSFVFLEFGKRIFPSRVSA